MVDLIDVWLPELKSIATFPKHMQSKPLAVLPWDGAEGGCYDLLTFSDVPDNVLPSSPMSNLKALHDLYNGLIRKQARQAKRQKTNPAYRPDAQDDANRLKKANDGDWVKVRDPAGVNVIQQGGVAQENVAFSVGIMDLFDRQAGNLSAMAGLGAQAPTASQEEMIHAAVSRKEAKMQQRVHKFTASVMSKIGHMMWADEFLEVAGQTEAVAGSGIMVDSAWTPEKREGDFWQYNFDIVIGSTNYESRESKIQKIERAMEKLQALYPMIEAVGGQIDVEALTKLYSEYLDIPELEKNVIVFMPPPDPQMQDAGGGSEGGSSMPANTTRNYVRRNVPTGGTPQARSNALQQSLYGNASQNQENMLGEVGSVRWKKSNTKLAKVSELCSQRLSRISGKTKVTCSTSQMSIMQLTKLTLWNRSQLEFIGIRLQNLMRTTKENGIVGAGHKPDGTLVMESRQARNEVLKLRGLSR